MKDGMLVAINKDGVSQIPVSSTMLIFLGPGTRVSGDAARFCALHNCHICFVRGGTNVHSYWMSGRWSDPKIIQNQVLKSVDPEKRLYVAKFLIKERLKREPKFSENEFDKFQQAASVPEILGLEANRARQIYKLEGNNSGAFKRDKSSIEGINGSLSLLNNSLYSICTAVIIKLGLHPSVGFIHGQSRRGGLSFDLADIFKYELTVKPSFTPGFSERTSKDKMRHLSTLIKQSGCIKEMIKICEFIAKEGDGA